MTALLDTQAFLWFVLDDPQLSLTAKRFMEDSTNELYISPASYWEIAIKIRIGKYSLPMPYLAFIESQLSLNAITILPIEPRHTHLLTTIAFHHRDPFDRLLISQALTEGLVIVSSDETFDLYGVNRLW
jgi:PIN domain nuclease of toxin-antitoxin system